MYYAAMIVDRFKIKDNDLEIHLEVDEKSISVVARYAGGGRVNGFCYQIDNIGAVNMQISSQLKSVKSLIEKAKSDVLNELWEEYEKELTELGKLQGVTLDKYKPRTRRQYD